MGRPFDEIRGFSEGNAARPEFAALGRWLDETPPAELQRRQEAAEATFRQLGITFAVYGEEEAAERIIPFDIVPRVFTAFFRGERSRSRETGGVGLGLTLAKRITEAHGGTIAATSQAGIGTQIRVAIPGA